MIRSTTISITQGSSTVTMHSLTLQTSASSIPSVYQGALAFYLMSRMGVPIPIQSSLPLNRFVAEAEPYLYEPPREEAPRPQQPTPNQQANRDPAPQQPPPSQQPMQQPGKAAPYNPQKEAPPPPNPPPTQTGKAPSPNPPSPQSRQMLPQNTAQTLQGRAEPPHPSSGKLVNPGAVFSQPQKSQMLKEVAIASLLLKRSKDEKGAEPTKTPLLLKTMSLQKNLETFRQTLASLEKTMSESGEADPLVEKQLEEGVKQIQKMESEIPQKAEKNPSQPPSYASPKEKLAFLKERLNQLQSSTQTTLKEQMATLSKRLEIPPKQQTGSPEEKGRPQGEQKTTTQTIKTPETPKEAKQPPPQTLSQTTQKEVLVQKDIAPRSGPQIGSSHPEALAQEKNAPPQVLKNLSDMKQLLQKMQNKELDFPTVLTLVYPLGEKKASQDASSKTKDKDSSDKEGKSPTKKKQKKEAEEEEEETQYLQPVALIPERNTILGDAFNENRKGEIPAKVVRVTPFLIGTTPITNQQFANWLNEAWENEKIHLTDDGIVTNKQGIVICKTHANEKTSQIHTMIYENHLSFAPLENAEFYPAVQLSWFGAQTYCEDYGLRLPTEIERETAAGMQVPGEKKSLVKFRYGFSKNDIEPSIANYDQEHLYPVGFYNGKNTILKDGEEILTQNGSSPYGCHDMSGNVREWIDGGSAKKKMTKGGSYQSPSSDLRVAARKYFDPEKCLPDVGFRVSLSI